MAVRREPMDYALRKRVLTRDGYVCRKCGSLRHLHLHHIIPVRVQQIDTEENLVTLCERCHQEWEHIICLRSPDISLEDWIAIPNALTLIRLFLLEKVWEEDISAKALRDFVLKMHGDFFEYQSNVTQENRMLDSIQKEKPKPVRKHRSISRTTRPRNRGGRPHRLQPEQVEMAQKLYADKSNTIEQICELLGVSRATLYRSIEIDDQHNVSEIT